MSANSEARIGNSPTSFEAEERWRMLVENHPDPIGITVEWQVAYINPAGARVLGASSPEELIGRPILDFLPEDIKEFESARYQQILEGAPGMRRESRIRRLDGTERDVEFYFSPITYLGRRATQAIFRDITERKIADAALRQNERLLRSVVTSAPLLLFAMDRQGTITLSEGRALDFVGARPGEMVGMNGIDLYGDIPGVKENMLRVLQGDHVHTIVPIQNRIFEAWYSPLENGNGNITGLSGVALDITDRHETEVALEHTQRRLQTLFEHTLEAIILADDQGRVIDSNPASCKLLGYSCEELRLLRLPDFIPALRSSPQTSVGALRRVPTGTEVLVHRKDGREIQIELHMAADIPGLHMVVLRDITEQRGAEVALRKSEERFSTTFQTIPVAASLTTFETERIVAVNDLFCEITGYAREELIGATIPDIDIVVEPATRAELLRLIGSDSRCRNADMKLRHRNGEIRDVLYSAVVMDFGGEPCILSMYNDITERRQMEHEILEISEKERRRIGQDLHDGLGSHLTGIAMLSRGLAYRSERGETISCDELDEIARLAVSGVEQARALARGLNPVKLEARGLIPALEELVRTTGRNTSIPCLFSASPEPPPLGIDCCVQLYRIAQEALSNAVRHGRPSRVDVSLLSHGDEVVLSVKDDGSGIGDQTVFSEGMGIRIMKHRASMIGADLSIESDPGAGTNVLCRLSLPD